LSRRISLPEAIPPDTRQFGMSVPSGHFNGIEDFPFLSKREITIPLSRRYMTRSIQRNHVVLVQSCLRDTVTSSDTPSPRP
jgi:hypothetical protein